ncbi:hypothetical protein [uncultured Tateyamaria sp.]|uniref:ATP-grasp domain-containing protein n=1 Tax=uncultured Tateyamaria sp. TaxID=455651 RepID=UPI002628139D|nr:hypothetical protein [uncultured Tateyamaria sp.]
MHYDLILATGRSDPNTACILAAAKRQNLSVCEIVPDENTEPAVTWDPVSGDLFVSGEKTTANGAFLRYDCFGPGGYTPDQSRSDRALAWFSTIASWAYASSSVRMFNRNHSQAAAHKGYAIHRAATLGVPIPRTLLTNARDAMAMMGPDHDLIGKPAAGGAFTAELNDLDAEVWATGTAPGPAIVQEKLIYPEYRVYLIGDAPVVFETHAQTLDFRADRDSKTIWRDTAILPPDLLAGLRTLAADLGLDFCAYDLKTRKETGELCYLEVNSGPMFSAFDALAEGTLAETMVTYLAQTPAPRQMAAE